MASDAARGAASDAIAQAMVNDLIARIHTCVERHPDVLRATHAGDDPAVIRNALRAVSAFWLERDARGQRKRNPYQ